MPLLKIVGNKNNSAQIRAEQKRSVFEAHIRKRADIKAVTLYACAVYFAHAYARAYARTRYYIVYIIR